jgi:hypothetical protein
MTKIHKATQMKIWRKNMKEGYQFFSPLKGYQPTQREVRGYASREDEIVWVKILLVCIACAILTILMASI